jgi:hypothetical protein
VPLNTAMGAALPPKRTTMARFHVILEPGKTISGPASQDWRQAQDIGQFKNGIAYVRVLPTKNLSVFPVLFQENELGCEVVHPEFRTQVRVVTLMAEHEDPARRTVPVIEKKP